MKTSMKEISIKEMDKVNGGIVRPLPTGKIEVTERVPAPPIEFIPAPTVGR